MVQGFPRRKHTFLEGVVRLLHHEIYNAKVETNHHSYARWNPT